MVQFLEKTSRRFALMNTDSLLEAARREKIVAEIARLVDTGLSQNEACFALSVSAATISRWRRAFEEKGRDGLLPKQPPGRPPLVVPSAGESLSLQRLLVTSNVRDGGGSKTSAARMFAQSDACSDALREAILKPRKSKHTLTRTIRRAMDVSENVIAEHRSPRALDLQISTSPGTMRMVRDYLADGTPVFRRLRGGERQSWDDGSINFVVCVPWPAGGCRCSDRWGVKVGRFQLLLGIDDASDFCPGFSFIIRPQSSYRALDSAGAMARAWMDDVLPQSVILEKGVWDSEVVRNFYHAAGVTVSHVHTPHQKLVENFWNRLWTQISFMPGQIGRFRGEMERENKELVACQDGRKDPRTIFPSLEESLDAIEAAITLLNSTPIESAEYGSWIPQERYFADLESHPRPALDPGLAWLLAPEQHEWTVRNNGLVGGKVACPIGPSIPYHFGHKTLWSFAGAKVRCYFDPYLNPIRATIVLAEKFKHLDAGEILTQEAECFDDAPLVLRMAERYVVGADDGALQRGINYRKSFLSAVRTEYRALGFGGRRNGASSTVDDGRGNRASISSGAAVQRAAAEHSPAVDVGTSPLGVADVGGRPAAAGETRRPNQQQTEDDFEAALDRVRALERDALECGDILPM